MINWNDKSEVETVIKVYYFLSAIDLAIAIMDALFGDPLFAFFMVLSGILFACGKWFQVRADAKGE